MNRKITMILHVLCPLVIGILVYCLTAPDVFFLRNAEGFLAGLGRRYLPMQDSVLVMLVRNYLPDMLWGYSLVFSLFFIIGNNAADIWKVLGIAFSFSAVMEIMQKISFVPGTFDVFDILAEFSAEAIAVYIIYKLYSREDL